MADHQGRRSKSRGQTPAEIRDHPDQLFEKRPVERDTRIPRLRRPNRVEDDLTGDETS